MRSYTYSEGKWAVCKDTFPTTAFSTEHSYRATETERKAWATYRDALIQAGFLTEASRYTCRFGSLAVYSRNHATLAQQRKQTENYDFLCVLRIGGTAIRVWIDALPNLFLFFTDVDARQPEDGALKDFLTDHSLHNLIGHLSALADQMWEGHTKLTIEVEQAE